MGRDKERPRLEILLDKESIYLKGTGVDVEPARLSGHVALYLAESTSIKEITLQFRGKARLLAPTHESLSLNSNPLTYIVCNHEWSFLEGEKKHSHTLKAGRHFFPFQLQLGGSLPSTISTSAFGGASVAYKLRAHVIRPGFNHNLQALAPVSIIRSFAPEALEYQQTLEIENTWPEKLMYSIMVPHKAWAAGDTITALVKFSPLLKGVGVLNINSSVHETIKIYTRTGHQEHTRIVASARHEVVGGRAVLVPEHRSRVHTPGFHSPSIHSPGHSVPGTPNLSAARSAVSASASGSGGGGGYFSFTPHPSSSVTPQTSHAGPSTSSEEAEQPSSSDAEEELEMSRDDIVTHLTLQVPLTITPTHALDPIIVTHRIRWSILILNPDGHTSELRCSLPLHLLDNRLLDEARMHTAATRRLLIGGPEVPPEDVEDDMELPSYNAHVRDRVANMYLPENATLRVTNPWVREGVSPVVGNLNSEIHSPWPMSQSGHSSPLEAHLLSHLPHAPGSGDSTPLDWVNSELLLSLSQDVPPTLNMNSRTHPRSHSNTPPSDHSAPGSNSGSNSGSRAASAHPSRRSSRASSPERGSPNGVNPQALHVAGPNETYIHSGNANRNVQGLFKATMKPLTSLAHNHWLPHRSSHSHSTSSLSGMVPSSSHSHSPYSSSHVSSNSTVYNAGSMPSTPAGRMVQLTDYNTGTALLHRAFTEVPDYRVASRGFIGGVPPLTSMRGLPSYEEAERANPHRTRSEMDLADRLSSALSMSGRRDRSPMVIVSQEGIESSTAEQADVARGRSVPVASTESAPAR
ncbi:hypothetical protein K435DRAFT_668900 [Dendrothele bispora CBS 962.96]|uniref:Arrestin C-terminal-like domain-containing protein n=1 Tax=Dendrothele bispora (strain CBS 962.96) TaxID=1314807 RepID=A0A4S8LX02_DENBC|nr:hypothetical protein K435DRAFT_668900 [Dendrothele bispora CBS 962.96]